MFWREEHTKRFLVELLCIACVGMTAALLIVRVQEERMKGMLLAHDASIAASLLESGMEELAVAEAIAGAWGSVSEGTAQGQEEALLWNAAEGAGRSGAPAAGDRLLGKIGLSGETEVRFLPGLWEACLPGRIVTVLTCMSFFALFSFVILRYLRRREKIYRGAIAAIEACGEEDFSLKLPELYEGTLYQLFSRINFMAGMLRTKGEAENRAKEFLKEAVADISHQLKTPLAALSLYQEILRNEPGEADTVAHFVGKSGAALRRMEGLIGTLLKLTRLDAGSVVFAKRDFDAAELALGAAEELTDRAKMEKKELLFSGEEGAKVYCDPEWTREALGNLIKNALDHTGEGDRVRVTWEQTPLATRFIVADTGEGIRGEDIHHIFKRFYRSRADSDRQGAGLGLALVRSIVDGQGGTVGVQSEAGKGAVFVLAFPTNLTKL